MSEWGKNAAASLVLPPLLWNHDSGWNLYHAVNLLGGVHVSAGSQLMELNDKQAAELKKHYNADYLV